MNLGRRQRGKSPECRMPTLELFSRCLKCEICSQRQRETRSQEWKRGPLSEMELSPSTRRGGGVGVSAPCHFSYFSFSQSHANKTKWMMASSFLLLLCSERGLLSALRGMKASFLPFVCICHHHQWRRRRLSPRSKDGGFFLSGSP